MDIFESACFNTWMLSNILVKKHGDVPFFDTPVTPHPCLETRRWYHNRV